MVDVYVGPDKAHFRVHKSFLCAKIPYFKKMFCSGFVEASENSATFPVDNAQSFDVLIGWVYTGILRPFNSGDASDDCYIWSPLLFYMLLDKLCLTELMDRLMDMLRENHRNLNLLFRLDDMVKSYKILRPGSAYRRYALHSLLYIFGMKEEPHRDIWTTSSILDAVQKKGDLAKDFFELLRGQVGTTPRDPRTDDDCVYHCHKANEECPLKAKKGNEKAMV